LRPHLPAADLLLPYLRRIDAARCYTNWGPLTSELEQRLSAHFAIPAGSVVSAASGTSALIGSILASAGRAGEDRPLAIVPAFTFVATASAVEQCGYRPHLADVLAADWALDPAAIARHPLLHRVGVVVVVSPFGRPVAQAPWVTFRGETGIPVVIDGAGAFEAIEADGDRLLGGIPVALSFHATKAFAIGEGGAVVTTDTGLAQRVTQALNFGFYEDRESRTPSTNGKMSEYHAAVGLAALDAWPASARAFRRVADEYRTQLATAGLVDRLVASPTVAGCYSLFTCRSQEEQIRIHESLASRGVEVRLWYGRGLHTQPRFLDLTRDTVPVTERIAPCLIGLPVAADLPADDIAHVVQGLVEGVQAAHEQ